MTFCFAHFPEPCYGSSDLEGLSLKLPYRLLAPYPVLPSSFALLWELYLPEKGHQSQRGI